VVKVLIGSSHVLLRQQRFPRPRRIFAGMA
jgi:hypothetical protein